MHFNAIMMVTYINDPTYFDQLWDLVPEDPCNNSITDDMIVLLPRAFLELKPGFFDNEMKIVPNGSYLLISDKRVISFHSNAILKQIIEEDPACWKFANTNGTMEEITGRGPIYAITDAQLLEKGILSLVDNIFKPIDHTEEYMQILGHELKIGDMVHISVYDAYSIDHNDIYFHLLIYDGIKLEIPKFEDNYGAIPPKEMAFPDFSIEHFSPLGRSGDLIGGYRWVTKDIISQYNEAEIFSETFFSFGGQKDCEPDFVIKILSINDKIYYFVGVENQYPIEKRQIYIDGPSGYIKDDELSGVPYILSIC